MNMTQYITVGFDDETSERIDKKIALEQNAQGLSHRLRRSEEDKKNPGDDLLSHRSSTIGAKGLNFRVRDGNGWFPLAMVTWKY